MSEMRRPSDSATAIVSEPPLPTWTKTSNGSCSSFSVIVIHAVPIGVWVRYVEPLRPRGRGLMTGWPIGEATAGLLSFFPTPMFRTCSPLHPSRNTVMPRHPSSHARR